MATTLDIHVEVDDYTAGRDGAIVDAAREVWAFKDGIDIFKYTIWMDHEGNGHRLGTDYAKDLRNAIWKANGAYCPVRVRIAFPEQTPYDDWNYEDEEDYDKWARTTTD